MQFKESEEKLEQGVEDKIGQVATGMGSAAKTAGVKGKVAIASLYLVMCRRICTALCRECSTWCASTMFPSAQLLLDGFLTSC